MGKGFYGKEYVKKDGDYDYQGQVNRLHNLKEWDRDETLAVAPQTPLSIDEMQERWNALDWMFADEKHWEADVIRKVDEVAAKKRRKDNFIDYKILNSTPIHSSVISRIAHSTEW